MAQKHLAFSDRNSKKTTVEMWGLDRGATSPWLNSRLLQAEGSDREQEQERAWPESLGPIVGRRQYVAAPALVDQVLPARLHALRPARVLVEACLRWILTAPLFGAKRPIDGAFRLQAGPLVRQATLSTVVLSHDHLAD